MFCNWCGKKIVKKGVSCPHCGKKQESLENGNGFWDLCGLEIENKKVVVQKTEVVPDSMSKDEKLNEIPRKETKPNNAKVPLFCVIGVMAVVVLMIAVVGMMKFRSFENKISSLENRIRSLETSKMTEETEVLPVTTPEMTATPGITVTPEATETPEVTITPEATETPEVTITPEVTKASEATEIPEQVDDSNISEELEVSEILESME